jgi:hypothetical protein
MMEVIDASPVLPAPVPLSPKREARGAKALADLSCGLLPIITKVVFVAVPIPSRPRKLVILGLFQVQRKLLDPGAM